MFNNETGRLVDFFDHSRLAEDVIDLLPDRRERARLGANAREFARAHYDLNAVCLPRQIECVRSLG